jgi:hypothetical protein
MAGEDTFDQVVRTQEIRLAAQIIQDRQRFGVIPIAQGFS